MSDRMIEEAEEIKRVTERNRLRAQKRGVNTISRYCEGRLEILNWFLNGKKVLDLQTGKDIEIPDKQDPETQRGK